MAQNGPQGNFGMNYVSPGVPEHHMQQPARFPPPLQQIGRSAGSSTPTYPVSHFSHNQALGTAGITSHDVVHGSLPPNHNVTVPKPPSGHGHGVNITNNIPFASKPAPPPTHSPHSINHHPQLYNAAFPASGIPPPSLQPLVNNHKHSPLVSPHFAPPAFSPSPVRPVQVPSAYNATVPVVSPVDHHPPPQTSPGHAHMPGTRPSYNPSAPPLSNYPTQSPSPQNIRPAPAWSQHSPAPVATPRYDSWPTLGGSPAYVNNKNRPIDLTQEKFHVLEKKPVLEPLSFRETMPNQFFVPPNQKNCSPEVFRCTLNAIPNSQGLLNKVKLPLGLIIHPFKDLDSLPVISAGTIVRCKRCRAYINPFVEFLDERRWRCNLCFVVNDVTEEFLHHPITKSYGEPHTRPECTNSTIEFIAPQEYMVRPPQPAVYMFLFDVSHAAIETGYLNVVCKRLLKKLDYLPGDKRTKIGFITYDGNIHFYKLADGASQPTMLVVSDIDDVFLPTPDYLLVNLNENKDLVRDLLEELPNMHSASNIIKGESETKCCLGSALQATFKLMSAYGGRITVFQQSLPNAGAGALNSRENPNARASSVSTASINPSTDFYKKMALELSGKQIAADFFFLNAQYIDIATLSCTSRFSAGDVHYYPNLHVTHNPLQVQRLICDFDRYLTRKIGLESVMRVRCTKGLAINTFHGNFFVRSTDLLALANINPDAGFGINLSIEDDISSLPFISIQAALLYTSSKGERRIRVHTMKFPTVKSAIDVFNAVDSDAVVALLSKMAIDRSMSSSLSDAKDALLNAVIDALKSYRDCSGCGSTTSAIFVPPCMTSYPLAISCLLKHPALRSGVSTRLDDRVFSMIEFKSQPIGYILQAIHPNLYRVDNLSEQGSADFGGNIVPQPNQLPLSAESLSRNGVYLMDTGWNLYLYVSAYSSKEFICDVLGVKQFSNIEQPMYCVPDLDNPASEMFNSFVDWLREQRPYYAALQVIRSDSREHHMFMQYLRLDKSESALSFQEFLLHVQKELAK